MNNQPAFPCAVTTPIVQSILDEKLAEIEAEAAATINAPLTNPWRFDGLATASVVYALIARLRAAEADAKRYRWLRSRLPGSAYRIAGVIYSEGGDGVDRAIDAAMERAP